MRFNEEDPSIVCPFYNRQNEKVLICRDDNVKDYSMIFQFKSVSDCVRYKDTYCRNVDRCKECAFHDHLAKRYRL